MAYIHKHEGNSEKKLLKQIILLGSIGLLLGCFMLGTSENPKDDFLFVSGLSAFVFILFLVISYKTNPFAWIKLFNKKKWENIHFNVGKITNVLENLSDKNFVFNWLIIEFFKIDHLVIGNHGIFVIKAVESGNFTLDEKGNLLLDGRDFKKHTGNLWRICHMLSMIIEKGFKLEIMPVPVITVVGKNFITMDDFDGIKIIELDKLSHEIESHGEKIKEEISSGFAWFISQRYILKHGTEKREFAGAEK